MAFTKCWLAYPEIRGCRCDAISLHTELTGETIDRAKAELAEGFKGLTGVAGVAVLMVIELVQEHIEDEPFAGLVGGDSLLPFPPVSVKRLVHEGAVFLLDVSAGPDADDLVQVLLRVQPPASHHLIKLAFPEGEDQRKGVDLRLLAVSEFFVLIHGAVSFH